MCRYRKYVFVNCNHAVFESPPYLPCVADGNYCSPEDPSNDPPIVLKKNTPCTDPSCAASAGMPLGETTDGGTSWSRTNSGNRGRALGPGEGDPGDRLRHTVSTKIKVANLVRRMTKKNRENKEAQKHNNGADGFLPDNNGSYDEIGNEMDDLKK